MKVRLARISTAFIFGMIFVLILDFLLFVGMKINYFDHYGIDEYFNTIFADNQCYLLLIVSALALGYAMLYMRGNVIFDRLYIVLILLFAATFYAPLGRWVGEVLFVKKNQTISIEHRTTTGDILYDGRYTLYLKKEGAAKATAIPKNLIHIP
jgi:hypothetical protein